MSPSRPYLLNALYEWIIDNNCTPYVAVNADFPGAIVPREYVKEGKIVLNINPAAVHKFHISNDVMQFSARFGGESRNLYIPMPAVMAIYAQENGAGMVFPEDEYKNYEPPTDEGGGGSGGKGQSGGGSGGGSKKPNLRVVK